MGGIDDPVRYAHYDASPPGAIATTTGRTLGKRAGGASVDADGQTTDDGLVGYGESSSFHAPLYNHETVDSCIHVQKNFIAPRVVGRDFDTPDQFRAAYADIVGNNCAKLGPECAFWHLVAQTENTSLKQLLGGVRTEIEVGESIGKQPHVDAGLKVVEESLERYRRIKMKIMPGWDINILTEIRRHWPDITLAADANCAYRSDQHMELMRSLEQFDLSLLEQPFPGDDMVGHAELQRRTKTAICLDESVESYEDARTAERLESCKVINIKPGRLGGLVESLRVYKYMVRHGIGVWCGGIFETGIGRAYSIAFASKENCVYPADMSPYDSFFSADLVTNSFVVKPSSCIDVPDEPGLGQGHCVVGLLLVTTWMRSCGRRLARRVARAMLVSPLVR